jgi:hypothetical protein
MIVVDSLCEVALKENTMTHKRAGTATAKLKLRSEYVIAYALSVQLVCSDFNQD